MDFKKSKLTCSIKYYHLEEFVQDLFLHFFSHKINRKQLLPITLKYFLISPKSKVKVYLPSINYANKGLEASS